MPYEHHYHGIEERKEQNQKMKKLQNEEGFEPE